MSLCVQLFLLHKKKCLYIAVFCFKLTWLCFQQIIKKVMTYCAAFLNLVTNHNRLQEMECLLEFIIQESGYELWDFYTS